MSRENTLPLAVALGAALLWGVWWVPVRELEALGFSGAWAGVAMNLGAVPALLLVVLLVGGRGRVTSRALGGAVLIGAAVTFFAASITHTTVLRALLLFYLAPAWTLAIECVFLGRRFRALNALALASALVGVVFVFRGDISLDRWQIGDLMALGSGVCWAAGATFVFLAPPVGVAPLALATTISAAALGTALSLAAGNQVAVDNGAAASAFAFGSGTIYLAPMILATLWGADKLPPATLTFLLTAEIISGVVSSAIILDEPFGWPECVGAALIVIATLIEVFAPAPLLGRGDAQKSA